MFRTVCILCACAMLQCTTVSAVIVNSIFDPDDQTILNGGGATVWDNTSVITINTDSLSITVTGTGAFSGTGNLGMTQGTSALGSQDVALFAFSDLSVGAGASLSLVGNRPLYLLSQNDLFFDATLDAGGADGTPSSSPGIGRLGGFSGGTPGAAGGGPGGGAGFNGNAGDGSGAGHATMGQSGVGSLGGPAYGDDAISDIIGGSGGGGVNGSGTFGTADRAGAAGGGAVGLIAQNELTLGATAVVDVSGGNGGNGNVGSGSGGSLILAAPSIEFESGSEIDVSGGELNFGGTTLQAGSAGRLAIYHDGSFTDNGVLLVGVGGTVVEAGGSLFSNNGISFPGQLLASSVPEPSTLGIFIAMFGIVFRRQRRK